MEVADFTTVDKAEFNCIVFETGADAGAFALNYFAC